MKTQSAECTFTIMVVAQEEEFLGWVQEYPLMHPLKGANPQIVVEKLEREINFLVKDRPDLHPLHIDIHFPI